MAQETHIRDSGSVWRKATEIHIFDGSVYRKATEVHIFDGTVWRQSFASASGGVVTITTGSISDPTTNRTSTAGVRFHSDGRIQKLVNTTRTQINASTDWIIPNGDADNTYEVRANYNWIEGSTWLSEPVAENTWIDLGTLREWSVQDTAAPPGLGTKEVAITFNIRKDGGATLATGIITLTADYDNGL